ncbi:unnamed protein product (macronuclear) [Paramecium tetraurelia]|uniref:Calponin-homology (CH) domain-containing protein n=1 Tax=Paramecium tetraurelia TaxID=5888 RepID=A0CVH3_PARTE|nr:uncharacterized protein GSPATT00010958001 [Paramecium tetraurelia]CAK74790.1 unnamed protein product [Paramecium tetraurelia]|eukprot:XP_001442187.1 hypothetical protein (macronuclear) [Paramecium tetraurelia strain d4-2]
MSLRLELLRWVNEKCPSMKASNIESLSDGRHFLCLLRKYFPDIEVPQFKKSSSIVQRMESLNLVALYCQKLDASFKIDVLKIANKEATTILNMLKFLKSILDKTPIKNSIIQEEFQTISKVLEKDNRKICEEVPAPQAQQTQDDETQTPEIKEDLSSLHQFQFQLKRLMSLKLQHPFLELELLRMLDFDQEVADMLQHYQLAIQKRSKNSKHTDYHSIHSSQFYYRGEANLLDVDYSFDQQQASKRSTEFDNLFQVSDEKFNL